MPVTGGEQTMDMEYYRNFIAIVEAGSLSAASKRVHVAQPALSNQLKLLQKKFGTQLVNIRRGVHNIELTNAGCILYNKAKYLCSLEDDTQREISDCVNGYTGTLRVSRFPLFKLTSANFPKNIRRSTMSCTKFPSWNKSIRC